MAEYQIPGGPYVNETDTFEAQLPGGPFLNETAAVAPPASSVIPVFVFHYRNQGIM